MNHSRWLAVLFGLLIVASFTALRGNDGVIAQTVRNLTFDNYQQLSPRKRTVQPVRIIDIDEQSLAKIGQFPWPRNEFAQLVEELKKLNAAAIVFDIIFSEKDRLSPRQILKRDDLKEWLGANAIGRSTKELPDNDELFAEAISKAPVVLAFGRNESGLSSTPASKSGFAFTGNATLEALHDTGRNTRLLAGLEKSARGIGSISVSPRSSSEVVRKYPLLWSHKGKVYPSLVMESLRVAQGASTFIIRGADFDEKIVESIKIGDISIATSRAGELWMHYAPDHSDLYIPAHKLLRATADNRAALREKIQGHIVLIGTSATGLFDIKTTSLAQSVPGVSIHAQAIEQILSQSFLWRPDWIEGLEIFLVIAVGLIIVFSATFLSPLTSFGIGFALALLLISASWFGFKYYGLLFDASFPLFSGLLVHFIMTAYRYLVTDKQARLITKAFSRYVSPDVLKDIQTDPKALELGGNTRRLTIMFVDIRNFTPLSEGLAPQELVAFLNKLLGELSLCITQEKGTIDKYIGDSIMAFWNAPLEIDDHEKHACTAALKMRTTLERLNAEDAFGFTRDGKNFGDIAIGVGINTGDACVGNLGSRERFDYSVIGDAVNVAARTESSCKELGTDILVTASTAQGVEGFARLDAGKILMKGKSKSQQIFVLVGDEQIGADKAFQTLSQAHNQLLVGTVKSKIKPMAESCKKMAVKILPRLGRFYEQLGMRLTNPPALTPLRGGKKSP